MTRGENTSGGAAAAGGFEFQAVLGAIAGIHAMRGTPVQWTDGLTAAAPCAVCFETAGPGDDLSLELTDGSTVEIQAKRRVDADQRRFWPAIDALCEGIDADRCTYGILVVGPHSSIPVKARYARALRRIGEGRQDGGAEHRELRERLKRRGYDPQKVCARIRIKTVSALDDDGDAVAAARSELGRICADDRQVIPAWHALCADALSAIASKGRRTVGDLSARLQAAQINLDETVEDSPVLIANALRRWTIYRTRYFQVLGVRQALPIETAWLPLKASVRDTSFEPASAAEQALADYQALGEEARGGRDLIDAETIGTFRKLCVVIGGPGSGKSLLLNRLAREFAQDWYVVVRVRLRDLAKRMQDGGSAVEEGLFRLGLDGSGVSPAQLHGASLSDLVILCDGLDECGNYQDDIASGLQNMAASHPSYRIVVTTRPIGYYSTAELHDWRHYKIVPLREADTPKHLATLCRGATGSSSDGSDELLPRIRAYLKKGRATRILARSPLLLGFGAALFLRWKEPSKTKAELYRRIFDLIDEAPVPRKSGTSPPGGAIRNPVLYQLGWLIAEAPLSDANDLERRCAQSMRVAMGGTYTQAHAAVEASIGYWEEAGLIERLRHPDGNLIAFIHKSCGEFAAALHLSEMSGDEARQAVTAGLASPDWNEILDFATQTPLATMLAEMLVAELGTAEPSWSALNRLFRIVVRPETALSTDERRAFLERVFALARSEDRQKAYRVGQCLAEHDLSRMPEAEGMALDLASAATEWSRLVGWAVLACHFPGSVDREELEGALNHFMERSRDERFFVRRRTTLPLGPHLDRGIFESFLLGALKSLLADREGEYQDRLLARVRETERDWTFGFVSDLEALLRELGREDLSRRSGSGAVPASIDFSVPEAFVVGSAALLTEVVPCALLRDNPGRPPHTGLKSLAGFFALAGIPETIASDVLVWSSRGWEIEAVHTLVRAAAYVFGLPAERLAAEAKEAIAAVESLRRESERKSFLGVLPDVDVGDVDWPRARGRRHRYGRSGGAGAPPLAMGPIPSGTVSRRTIGGDGAFGRV